jgi:hypothetical protein
MMRDLEIADDLWRGNTKSVKHCAPFFETRTIDHAGNTN